MWNAIEQNCTENVKTVAGILFIVQGPIENMSFRSFFVLEAGNQNYKATKRKKLKELDIFCVLKTTDKFPQRTFEAFGRLLRMFNKKENKCKF